MKAGSVIEDHQEEKLSFYSTVHQETQPTNILSLTKQNGTSFSLKRHGGARKRNRTQVEK